jgi:hypothetical protein
VDRQEETPVGVEPTWNGFADHRLSNRLRRPWVGVVRQRPRQESNLVCDLRKVACLHHTPRTIRAYSILARSRTEFENLGQSHVIRYTTRMRTRADDWVRTSILRLTRSAPFCHRATSAYERVSGGN